MGCFHSTPLPSGTIDRNPAPKTDGGFHTTAASAAAARVANAPMHQMPMLDVAVTALPADPDADPSAQVLSVPRAAVTVGDRERAELRVKNLRDKLHSSISRSEDVLHDEARMAIRLRREGRDASARVLLHRRVLLKAKIGRAEAMLSGVMDMIEGLEQAQDNKRLVEALERGTFAINEIAKDVSIERMDDALMDSHAAIDYVNSINEVVHIDANDMSDADFEHMMVDIENEFGDDIDAGAGRVDEPDIPEVPAEMPEMPAEAPEMPELPQMSDTPPKINKAVAPLPA